MGRQLCTSYVQFQQKESNVFHGKRGKTSYIVLLSGNLLYITEAGGWENVTGTCKFNIKDTYCSKSAFNFNSLLIC
jgi:hypothetical protein